MAHIAAGSQLCSPDPAESQQCSSERAGSRLQSPDSAVVGHAVNCEAASAPAGSQGAEAQESDSGGRMVDGEARIMPPTVPDSAAGAESSEDGRPISERLFAVLSTACERSALMHVGEQC